MPANSASTEPRSRSPSAHVSVNLRHESPSPASAACTPRAQAVRDGGTWQSGLAWRVSPIHRMLEESNQTTESHLMPAEVWFNQSNKNAGGRLSPQFLDDDPPFYLQNQNLPYPNLGYDTEETSHSPRTFNRNISQFSSEFMLEGTNKSNVDDFRSVIDDLTIENKKLKEKLRKYERCYATHLEKDKLFELKIHSLNPSKKRDLEQTLYAFASSIGKDEPTSGPQIPLKDDKYLEAFLPHASENPSSASTNSPLVDSAYASMSTLGPISSSTPNRVGTEKKSGLLTAALKLGKIQPFQDDIPPGLLPKHPPVLTKRGKKKLVVRRLERLFTDELRPSQGTSQPQPQQRVSNSAAQDNCQVIGYRGQQVLAEGVRKAYILAPEMELERVKLPKLPADSSAHSSTASQAEGVESGSDAPSPPGQRPTRPINLDPDHAQVPAGNIEYIRHLGISTPVMAIEDSMDVVANDTHGWVYLNLLINMAQLHIINVTPDFVRSAVTELSTKFQLSPDGKKIRWKGGTRGTEFSSDSGGESALRLCPIDNSNLDVDIQQKRKVDFNVQRGPATEQTLKEGQSSTAFIDTLDSSKPVHGYKQQRDLCYKPLFAHHSSSEDDEMSTDDSISAVSHIPANESSTSLTPNDARARGRQSHSGLPSKRKRNDGAIVFYSGAPFCIDHSGDRDHISTSLHAYSADVDSFNSRVHDALGCSPRRTLRRLPSRTPSGSALPFRPFKEHSVCAGFLLENEARSQTPDAIKKDDDDNVGISPPWASIEEQQNLYPMRLEACGLGGTQPADHFTVRVETRRMKLDRKTRLELSKYSASAPKSKRLRHVISKSSTEPFQSPRTEESTTRQIPRIWDESVPTSQSPSPKGLPLKAEILSTQTEYLRPSDLPPPAMYHGASSSSTVWSDDSSSEGDRGGVSGIQRRPRFLSRTFISTFPYDPMDLNGLKGNCEASEIDESDTSSIDIAPRTRN